MSNRVSDNQSYTDNIQSRSLGHFQDLRDVLEHYQSQPDMLKLILGSKVEEDRRRAEEAKLRIKEIDLFHRKYTVLSTSPRQCYPPILSSTPNYIPHTLDDHYHQKRRNSAAVAMLAMGNCIPHTSSHDQHTNTKIPSSLTRDPTDSLPCTVPDAYPSPVLEYDDSHENSVPARPARRTRTRQRCETEKATKIVETRMFPYARSEKNKLQKHD